MVHFFIVHKWILAILFCLLGFALHSPHALAAPSGWKSLQAHTYMGQKFTIHYPPDYTASLKEVNGHTDDLMEELKYSYFELTKIDDKGTHTIHLGSQSPYEWYGCGIDLRTKAWEGDQNALNELKNYCPEVPIMIDGREYTMWVFKPRPDEEQSVFAVIFTSSQDNKYSPYQGHPQFRMHSDSTDEKYIEEFKQIIETLHLVSATTSPIPTIQRGPQAKKPIPQKQQRIPTPSMTAKQGFTSEATGTAQNFWTGVTNGLSGGFQWTKNALTHGLNSTIHFLTWWNKTDDIPIATSDSKIGSEEEQELLRLIQNITPPPLQPHKQPLSQQQIAQSANILLGRYGYSLHNGLLTDEELACEKDTLGSAKVAALGAEFAAAGAILTREALSKALTLIQTGSAPGVLLVIFTDYTMQKLLDPSWWNGNKNEYDRVDAVVFITKKAGGLLVGRLMGKDSSVFKKLIADETASANVDKLKQVYTDYYKNNELAEPAILHFGGDNKVKGVTIYDPNSNHATLLISSACTLENHQMYVFQYTVDNKGIPSQSAPCSRESIDAESGEGTKACGKN